MIILKKRKVKKNKLLKALEIPEEIAAGAVKLSVTGFNKLRIDNYKSLIEYENNVIRVNTGEKLIKIEGENFDISSVTDESVEITGDVYGMRFE